MSQDAIKTTASCCSKKVNELVSGQTNLWHFPASFIEKNNQQMTCSEKPILLSCCCTGTIGGGGLGLTGAPSGYAYVYSYILSVVVKQTRR